MESPAATAHYHAQTGVIPYDMTLFSARPKVHRVGGRDRRFEIVRHDGYDSAREREHSSVLLPDVDALTLNLMSGGMGVFRGDGAKVQRPLRRGACSFIPAGVDASLETPVTHRAVVLYFPTGALATAVEPLTAKGFELQLARENPQLTNLIGCMVAELAAPGAGSDILLDGVMVAMATLLARGDGTAIADEADRIYLSPARRNRVIAYVEDHLDREITLHELASLAGLSAFHFARVFKRSTGESPYQFVCRRRIDRARELLLSGDMPLSELALHCGFSSQAHFTSAFSRSTGLSPGRFRRSGHTDGRDEVE